VKHPPKIDRSAVMRAAHKQWRYVRSKGWHLRSHWDVWTWNRVLRWAWAAARQRRAELVAYHAERPRGRDVNRPFPLAA
jgi:hypothetical protein